MRAESRAHAECKFSPTDSDFTFIHFGEGRTHDHSLLFFYLALSTFGIAICAGLYQLYRVKKARREHHRSARTPDEVARNL